MNEINKAEQVQRQYQAVARLARSLADVHEEIGPAIPHMNSGVVELMGKRSACIMETLGDILNGMDAATEDDADMDSIFDAARQMFPAETVET